MTKNPIHTAQKNHGPCDTCNHDIRKGQRYRRSVRHATEEERQNPKVQTVTTRPGMGPQKIIKLHEDCPHPATVV